MRFYGIGEYGDERGRPHYHAMLFNFPTCVYGDSGLDQTNTCGCRVCQLVSSTWRFGRVHVGTVEARSAYYIAGYTLKGMFRFDDPRLKGRYPEFSRKSLKPGIGALALPTIADALREHQVLALEGDVVGALRHGKKILPIGPYLRRKLRAEFGLDEAAPACTVDLAKASMQDLREIAASLTDEATHRGLVNRRVYRGLMVERAKIKEGQLKARLAIYEGKKK